MPYALLGYTTDYANGVKDEATPVEELLRLIRASGEVFGAVLVKALPLVAGSDLSPSGVIYRFE